MIFFVSQRMRRTVKFLNWNDLGPGVSKNPALFGKEGMGRSSLIWEANKSLARFLRFVGTRVVLFGQKFSNGVPKEELYRLPRCVPLGEVRPSVLDNCFIAPSAVVIGNVNVGRKCYIGFGAVLRGDEGTGIHLGESCNVQEKCVVTGSTTIGKWATIEPMCVVESADVGSCSFVGAAAILMKGSRVESKAMLCSAAVLQAGATVPSGEIWAGNPAKKIGLLTEEEQEFIVKAAKHFVFRGIENQDSCTKTWEQLDAMKDAREIMWGLLQNSIEVRSQPYYVREPPKPRKEPKHLTPYERMKGKDAQTLSHFQSNVSGEIKEY